MSEPPSPVRETCITVGEAANDDVAATAESINVKNIVFDGIWYSPEQDGCEQPLTPAERK
jgi:hypothetical protein